MGRLLTVALRRLEGGSCIDTANTRPKLVLDNELMHLEQETRRLGKVVRAQFGTSPQNHLLSLIDRPRDRIEKARHVPLLDGSSFLDTRVDDPFFVMRLELEEDNTGALGLFVAVPASSKQLRTFKTRQSLLVHGHIGSIEVDRRDGCCLVMLERRNIKYTGLDCPMVDLYNKM